MLKKTWLVDFRCFIANNFNKYILKLKKGYFKIGLKFHFVLNCSLKLIGG